MEPEDRQELVDVLELRASSSHVEEQLPVPAGPVVLVETTNLMEPFGAEEDGLLQKSKAPPPERLQSHPSRQEPSVMRFLVGQATLVEHVTVTNDGPRIRETLKGSVDDVKRTGQQQVVGIKETVDVTSRLREAVVQALRRAGVALGDTDGHVLAVSVDDALRAVSRPGVDHDQLDVVTTLLDHALDRCRDELALVVGQHDQTDHWE